MNNLDNHYKFTGKERDGETGLDYFGARHYSNTLGRFISADWSAVPEPVPYADFSDPQSLNLYTYVRNIPTSRADGDGHGPCPPCLDELKQAVRVVEYVAEHPEVAVPLATTLAAPAAGSVAPALLLAAPSAGAMTLVVAGPKFAPPEEGCLAVYCDVYMWPAPKAEDDKPKIEPEPKVEPEPDQEHTTGARPSTKQKHEDGQARKKRDQGGSKARQKPGFRKYRDFQKSKEQKAEEARRREEEKKRKAKWRKIKDQG